MDLSDLIARNAAFTPQKVALRYAGRLLTYAAFWQHRIGSITPGKLADLAILSDDIMTMPEDRIPEAKVLTTLLAGQPVHDSGLF